MGREVVITTWDYDMKQFTSNPFYKFILFPVGQMLVFILGASIILSLFIILMAFIFRDTITNFDLLERTVTILPKVLVDGITIGFVYATIALGYTMVYGVLEFINFSHSEIFMVGAIVGVELMRFMAAQGILETTNEYVVIGLAILLGMVISGALDLTVERVAYKPRRCPPLLVCSCIANF